jgi:hypothetical protein
MGILNDQVGKYLEKLLSSMAGTVGGKVGELTDSKDGSFVITYTGEDKGITGASQFLNKLKAGGFIKEEDLPKINPKDIQGDINIYTIKNNPDFSINVNKDSTSITFTPNGNYETIFTRLRKSIEISNKDPKYTLHIKEHRELGAIVKLPANSETVSNYLRKKIKSEFPKEDIKVVYSNGLTNEEGITLTKPEFIVTFTNKSADGLARLDSLVKVLKKTLGDSDIVDFPVEVKRFQANSDNSKLGLSVSGSPALLVALINKNDPDNFPKIEKKDSVER